MNAQHSVWRFVVDAWTYRYDYSLAMVGPGILVVAALPLGIVLGSLPIVCLALLTAAALLVLTARLYSQWEQPSSAARIMSKDHAERLYALDTTAIAVPVYSISLDDGRTIQCTKHEWDRFSEGDVVREEARSLALTVVEPARRQAAPTDRTYETSAHGAGPVGLR